jgi:ATP-dependent DNA ligase
MNIFQLLGLKPDHRPNEKKTTQLVKHWDEVSEIHKQPTKRFGLQLKKDGVCAITIIRDGTPTIWSRTAKRFTNTWQIDKAIFSMGLRDGVYFGELTCDLEGVSLEVLSGITNPNRVKPLDSKQDKIARSLTMNFFDMVSIESFIEGASQTPFQTRYNHLVERVYGVEARSDSEPTNYVPTSINVINMFQIEQSEIDGWLEVAVKNKEEGIIIIDLDAGWEAGHKGWRKMKKVRGCDYDLLCIGYEDGKGKSQGLVANLFFKWKDGKTIKCSLGKGWTHQMAREMFHAAEFQKNHGKNHSQSVTQSSPIGQIFQVYALEESSKGKLRLPKVGEQRHDKGESDV